MDRRAAAEPEFFNGYQAWLASRYVEVMGRRYPNATIDQVCAAVRQGQIPPDLVRHVQAEERQLYKDAIARGQDPADAVEGMMVGRGWQRASTRAAIAQEHRRQEAARAPAEQRKQEAIDETMRGLSLKIQYGAASELTRGERRFYLKHCKNPNAAQAVFSS